MYIPKVESIPDIYRSVRARSAQLYGYVIDRSDLNEQGTSRVEQFLSGFSVIANDVLFSPDRPQK